MDIIREMMIKLASAVHFHSDFPAGSFGYEFDRLDAACAGAKLSVLEAIFGKLVRVDEAQEDTQSE